MSLGGISGPVWGDRGKLALPGQENGASWKGGGAAAAGRVGSVPLKAPQSKAYAAEIGAMLAKLDQLGNSASGRVGWLKYFADQAGAPIRTVDSWWLAFWRETRRALPPRSDGDTAQGVCGRDWSDFGHFV